jgi:hypothetical protein
MTKILNVRDANTGHIVAVDLDSPAGSYYVVDSETGQLKLINLTTKSGSYYINDANTGKSKLIDLANLSGSIYTRDENTGKLVLVNFASPSGTIYVTDANTGKLVQIDLSKYIVLNQGNSFSIASGAAAQTPWYLSGGISDASCIAAYAAKGAASYAASKVNLSHPGTNDLSEGPGGAVSWATGTGWSFTGDSNKRFNTGVVPVLSYTVIIQVANVVSQIAIGSVKGAGQNYEISPVSGDNISVGYEAGDSIVVLPQLPNGNLALVGQAPYRNGVANGPTITGSANFAGVPLYIGCANLLGIAATAGFTGQIHSVAIYNTSLSPSQVLAVAEAMNGSPF